MQPIRFGALGFVLLALAACAETPEAKAPTGPAPAPQPAAPAAPQGAVERASLELVLREGPPWLLERVPIEEVMDNGKFVGWRVLEMPPEWQGVDLVPGDVVTAVNGQKLETPQDFWSAWTTLTVASEIKVAYTREGQARELAVPVHGQPDPAIAQRMQAPAPPPDQRTQPEPEKRGRTIVIKGDDRPLSDTTVDWSAD
jgi:S1-C subfamily serine protease